MGETERQRMDALIALLRIDRSPVELQALLAKVPWDSDRPLVTLDRRGLRDVLEAAAGGRIPVEYVQPWAEMIECREDVGYEVGNEDLLIEAVFALANPTLAGEEISTLVREWIPRLA